MFNLSKWTTRVASLGWRRPQESRRGAGSGYTEVSPGRLYVGEEVNRNVGMLRVTEAGTWDAVEVEATPVFVRSSTGPLSKRGINLLLSVHQRRRHWLVPE